VETVKVIADCVESQFSPHDLCKENHEEQGAACIQALLEAADDNHPERVGSYDVLKIISSLKLKEACGLNDIPNERHRHFQRKPIVHLIHLSNHCLCLLHFPSSWKETKFIALPNPGKNLKFPENLRLIRLLPTTGKLF
jgi:hypothetical protein